MRGTLDTIGDNENLTQDSIAISNYDNSISVSNRVYKQGLKILSTVLFSSNKNSNCTPNHCKKLAVCGTQWLPFAFCPSPLLYSFSVAIIFAYIM